MTEKLHVISGIVPGSIAEELEIEPGDVLCGMNGSVIDDIFDYQFHMENEYLEILIRKKDTDEEWLLEVEKDEDEDLAEYEVKLFDLKKIEHIHVERMIEEVH